MRISGDTTGTVIVGAGIGGLVAALQLAHAGAPVTVLDRHASPGGKIRTMPSNAGPVDAGPTVLTMRSVFDEIFASVGERLEDYLHLRPLKTLARHFWSDGTTLDLTTDAAECAANIDGVFGSRAATEFRAFHARTGRLFDAFEGPLMRNPAPRRRNLAALALRHPQLVADMATISSMATLLRRSFSEPRLRQLFGRYATYVGGIPQHSPAVLSLIWQAEARGVWAVDGGIAALSRCLTQLAEARGARFVGGADVSRIDHSDGGRSVVHTGSARYPAATVLFNGDPRALRDGMLGDDVRGAVARSAVAPRSLSAHVMSFAARAEGLPLAHHNVLFGDDPNDEFADLAANRCPRDPTLYICAQDRNDDALTGPERFEVIVNAPPLPHSHPKDADSCLTLIHTRLARFGLRLDPMPGARAMTTPQDFADAFPGSQGAIYGRSPAGMSATFQRPTARSRIAGLYLCGGGTHPGAGLPMAALSGQHAGAAILADRASISTCRRADTPGGISTGSATTKAEPSRS